MSATHGDKKRKDQRGKGTGCIFKPKTSKYYYIAYMSGGIRRYESSKSVLKSDAQRLLSQRIGDTARGVVVTPHVGKLSLWDGLKAVIERQKQDGRRSIAHTERRIQLHILKFFPSARLMASLTTGDIEDYVTHRLGQKAKPASVNRELAILRQAFRRAVRAGRLLSYPEIKLLAENNIREEYFEAWEFAALVEAMAATYPDKPEYLPLLRVLYLLPWRLQELQALKVPQVDLNAGTIRLQSVDSKTGQPREIVLTSELHDILKAQLDSVKALKKEGIICPYVFHRLTGKKRGQEIKSWRTCFVKACKAAGLKAAGPNPNKRFHDFRRTGSRNLIRAGVPETVVMKITGHKTRATLDRYNRTSHTDLREAALKMESYATEQERDLKVKRFPRAVGGPL